MVLVLKHWKSRSPPGIVAGGQARFIPIHKSKGCPSRTALLASLPIFPTVASCPGDPSWISQGRFGCCRSRPAKGAIGDAGWSSPVARQAHNLKVVGSNPTPATTKTHSKSRNNTRLTVTSGVFCVSALRAGVRRSLADLAVGCCQSNSLHSALFDEFASGGYN